MTSTRASIKHKSPGDGGGKCVPGLGNVLTTNEPVVLSSFHKAGGANATGMTRHRLFRVSSVDALTRLALAAQGGDQAAFDQLVEGAYAQVWRLCARLVEEQCADDLAQESFLRAVHALPTFRAEASARTWLLAIARNTCRDEVRTRGRRRRRDAALVAGRVNEERMTTDAGHEVVVTDVVARLTPERREAFVLTQLLVPDWRALGPTYSAPCRTLAQPAPRRAAARRTKTARTP
jgi:RNA polymerase sigma-70 factor (ECF subfamily)